MATDLKTPAPDERSTPDERPRQLVTGLLQLLQQTQHQHGLAPGDDLHTELARRLEETVRTFAEELRAELPAWRDAAVALRRLTECRLLPDATAATALHGELTRAGAQALQLLRSLESIPPPSPAAVAPPCSEETVEHTAALDQTLDVIPLAPETSHVAAGPAGPDPVAALECVRAGDASRRSGDHAQALRWYAEALRHDPGSARAYLRRGQTFLLEGQTARAIEELTAAARLTPNDAEPYLRRGDALARLGQWRRALEDYGRAIHLRPDLPLARHNRAVVFSLAGNHVRAIAELTVVLEMDPDYAPAYFNRGAAHLAIGQYDDAIEDLTHVLELSPDDAEAQAKLEEACQLRDAEAAEAIASLFIEAPPPTPPTPPPAPPAAARRAAPTAPAPATAKPAPAPPAPANGKTESRRNGHSPAPKNGTAEQTIRPTPSPQPPALQTKVEQPTARTEQPAAKTEQAAAKTEQPTAKTEQPATKTDQPTARTEQSATKTDQPTTKTASGTSKNDPGDLIVVCPDCGAIGSVRWDRLNRILACKGCARLYRVSEDGQLAAVTRTAAGRWIETSRLRPLMERLSLTPPRLLLIGVLLLGMLATVAWRFSSTNTAPPPEEPLPLELEPRAELLARSWLRRDVRTMRRLALYTHERSVFPWLHRHPPPLKRKAEKADLEGVRFEIQLRRKTGNTSDLVVRVHGLTIARHPGPIEMAQRWQENAETWYYLPPSR